MTEQSRDAFGRYIPASAAQAERDEAFNGQLFSAAGRERAAPPPATSTISIPAGVFEPVPDDRRPKGDWLQQAFARQRYAIPLPESRNPEA